MAAFVDHPAVLFSTLLIIFVAAVAFGAHVVRRVLPLPEDEREEFNIVQTSTLTLLALLIGFSLSMAVGRYDTRKALRKTKQMQSAPNMHAQIWRTRQLAPR